VLSISRHKNIETLLGAFSKLVVQIAGNGATEGLELIVAGPSVEHSVYRSLVSLVHGLGIDGRVHFLGRVAHDQLAALYRGAALFVLPSRLETFGLPLVEAMACGAPVVTSDLPICREICEDAALYFAAEDLNDLASHMQTTLEDSDLAQRMIERGLRRAADFSWNEAARKLVDVFEDVVPSPHHLHEA
jgi:glycosyltransferase involved in cell wall biosynthesis